MLEFYFYTITEGKEELLETVPVPNPHGKVVIPDRWAMVSFIERRVMDQFPSCMFVNVEAKRFKARFEARRVYTTDDSGTFVDVVVRNLFWTDYR